VLDSDPARIGHPTPAGLLVEDSSRIHEIVRDRGVMIGVITTPVSGAQAVCDDLISAGLKTVLNFAPIRVRAPEEVLVKSVDLKIYLEELSFYLTHSI
jgi:redox-sensing transcriptional repressor